MLRRAALCALRGMGDVEPNPMVGCVIARDGQVLGIGHHRKFGGMHAEREALAACRAAGRDARGATVYVTLEPCCHHGKTPPCTDALIEAGVARVVCAVRDPGPVSGGGGEVLRRAGIGFAVCGEELAEAVSAPFRKRIEAGRPWVVAKWAQTVEGRMTTPPRSAGATGEARWISGEVSRRRVHRLRARVDAVVTGIGTVLADDPRLNARGVRVRRVARRVVVDSRLRMPVVAALARGAADGPVTVVCDRDVLASPVGARAARGLIEAGRGTLDVVGVGRAGDGLDTGEVLGVLGERHGVATVMVEAGPRLLAGFCAAGLVDMAIVHVAGEGAQVEPARVTMAVEHGLGLCAVRRSGRDTELIYRAGAGL